MEEELNQLTLIGRTEIQGEKYPLFLERLGLIFSIFLTIFLCISFSNEFDFSIITEILLCSCIGPLFALSLAEIIGRIFQKIFN